VSSSTVVRFRVNGRDVEIFSSVRTTAAELLRDQLKLTGTKVSCELQVCGACTILVNDAPVSSCCMLACDLDGTTVLTIEGVANGRELHPLQEAFVETNALQCGFCTPGFIMMTLGLFAACPAPDAAKVREWLDGNLCRCTGYQPIETAVLLAAERLQDGTTRA
jgi:aerobic-type carbon monoxide dehydrogenase small subunit (CoxS/CutS family)